MFSEMGKAPQLPVFVSGGFVFAATIRLVMDFGEVEWGSLLRLDCSLGDHGGPQYSDAYMLKWRRRNTAVVVFFFF